jgi:hypothetical protein
MRVGAVILCFLISFAAAAAAPSVRVYRVDEATAKISGHQLVIVAKGAVRTGGWEKPKLVVHEPSASEAHQMSVEFVATPPRNGKAVAQSIVPVSVTLKTRLPRYAVTDVKIVSETNTVTARIVFRQRPIKTAMQQAR